MSQREWDSPISPQTLVEQINEEGAAWGLVGEYDEAAQRVFVCELRPVCEAQGGIVEHVEEAGTRRLCSVDNRRSFSAVLANRITALEAENPGIRYERHYNAQDRAKQQRLEAHRQEVKSATKLRMSGGARFYAGMNEDLATLRRAKRIREEMRRRGLAP